HLIWFVLPKNFPLKSTKTQSFPLIPLPRHCFSFVCQRSRFVRWYKKFQWQPLEKSIGQVVSLLKRNRSPRLHSLLRPHPPRPALTNLLSSSWTKGPEVGE